MKCICVPWKCLNLNTTQKMSTLLFGQRRNTPTKVLWSSGISCLGKLNWKSLKTEQGTTVCLKYFKDKLHNLSYMHQKGSFCGEEIDEILFWRENMKGGKKFEFKIWLIFFVLKLMTCHVWQVNWICYK